MYCMYCMRQFMLQCVAWEVERQSCTEVPGFILSYSLFIVYVSFSKTFSCSRCYLCALEKGAIQYASFSVYYKDTDVHYVEPS